MQFEPTERRRRRIIGLTPLIDVVFILLVFFMLASSFMDWQSISLGVPGNGGAGDPDSDTIMVRLFEDGRMEVDGDVLDIEALSPRFRDTFSANPDRAVVVRPDAGVSLQRVVKVVERLNDAGGSRITLNRETR